MNCRKVRQFLWNYLDKDIEQRQKEEIESHLKECSKCAAEVAELAKLREIFHKTEVLKPSPDFNKKLLNRIQTDSVSNRVVEVVRPKPSFSWRWAFASLAAGLAVVFIALFYQDIFYPQRPGTTISETPALTEVDQRKAQEEESLIPRGYKSTRFVMDNLRMGELRRIDDFKIDRSQMARFVMESIPPSRMQTRRTSNQFVLPAVSTRTVAEKSSF